MIGHRALRGCEDSRCRSVCPWLFATPDSFRNLGLKRRWAERIPVLFHLIDQQSLIFRTERHQPVQRLSLGAITDRDHHVDRQTMPEEIGRQHDHVGFVRAHPFRQRTRGREPPANEFAARMLRTFAVDRTAMFDAERTGLARPDLVATHFDLQPAIAACRTASAGSQGLLLQPTALQKNGGQAKS
jgi:hypothetical protein